MCIGCFSGLNLVEYLLSIRFLSGVMWEFDSGTWLWIDLNPSRANTFSVDLSECGVNFRRF